MCFFFKQSKDATELKNRFNAKIENNSTFVANNYNGFDYPQTPVITNKKPDYIQFFNWGLIPFWAKNDEIKKYTINAKIETLTEKPSFKNSVNNRCLIIADGFFEWQWLDTKGKNKQKYLISLPNNELFAFAGIWSEWKHNITGQTILSYSLVTTEANELMSKIHNSKKRMPIILSYSTESEWLNNAPIENFRFLKTELIANKI